MFYKFVFVLLSVITLQWCVCSTDDCSRVCPLNYNPKCGSDGIIYGNGCALETEICLSPIRLIEEPLINCVNKFCPDNCAADDETCKEGIITCKQPYQPWL